MIPETLNHIEPFRTSNQISEPTDYFANTTPLFEYQTPSLGAATQNACTDIPVLECRGVYVNTTHPDIPDGLTANNLQITGEVFNGQQPIIDLKAVHQEAAPHIDLNTFLSHFSGDVIADWNEQNEITGFHHVSNNQVDFDLQGEFGFSAPFAPCTSNPAAQCLDLGGEVNTVILVDSIKRNTSTVEKPPLFNDFTSDAAIVALSLAALGIGLHYAKIAAEKIGKRLSEVHFPEVHLPAINKKK